MSHESDMQRMLSEAVDREAEIERLTTRALAAESALANEADEQAMLRAALAGTDKTLARVTRERDELQRRADRYAAELVALTKRPDDRFVQMWRRAEKAEEERDAAVARSAVLREALAGLARRRGDADCWCTDAEWAHSAPAHCAACDEIRALLAKEST